MYFLNILFFLFCIIQTACNQQFKEKVNTFSGKKPVLNSSISIKQEYYKNSPAESDTLFDSFFRKDTTINLLTRDGRIIERYFHGPRSSWGYTEDEKAAWEYRPGRNGIDPLDSAIWKGRGSAKLQADKQYVNTFYIVPPKQPRTGDPLYVILHSANGTAFMYLARQFLFDGWETISTRVPDDFYALYLNSPNREWWGWGDRNKGYPAPAEKRVIDIIKWVVEEYKIDINRIYLSGPSMGGCGTLAIGLANGDIFAAIRATIPAGTEYAAARMGGFPKKPREEASVRLNDDWRKCISGFGKPDPPVLVNFSSQTDRWSKTQPELLYAAQEGHFSMVLGWGPFGHSNLDEKISIYPLCQAALAFPWLEIRKNEAYPVFTHASCDQQSPWYGDTANFQESGQMNAYFRWKNLSDTPKSFTISLWIEHPQLKDTLLKMPDAATSDITLRRLQNFKVKKGKTYKWVLKQSGKRIGSGKLTPDAANLLTISDLPITTIPSELSVIP